MARRPGTAAPAPRILRNVLPPDLLQSFQLYVRELARRGGLSYERAERRRVRHNDPFAVLIHEALVPRVRRWVGRPVKKSYVYLACYGEGGRLARHVDRPQCRYTLDLCVEEGRGPRWPLVVDGREYVFGTNEALLYFGCEQVHERAVKPRGKLAHLAFFHFVDPGFKGSLD